MENTQERYNLELHWFDVRNIAERLLNLPTTFGETLVMHMKKRGLTSETMAEALGVSTRKVSTLRNAVDPSISLRQLTAICILLRLSPEFSDDMIFKARIRSLPTAEHVAYRMLLRTMYCETLQTCNALLRAANLEPLTEDKIN